MIDIVNHIQQRIKNTKESHSILTKIYSFKRTNRIQLGLSILCIKSNHIYNS